MEVKYRVCDRIARPDECAVRGMRLFRSKRLCHDSQRTFISCHPSIMFSRSLKHMGTRRGQLPRSLRLSEVFPITARGTGVLQSE